MTKRVLIVDDNSTNLYMLETILKGYGYEVIQAKNGKEALDNAISNPPDMVVTDILMPVMDGYTLCRQWKSDDTLKHIPLVFYTATYTESKNKDFALSLGADLFILKPQEPDILMNMLKEVLEEKDATKKAAFKPLGDEMEFFRQYNEILFSKLEKKISDLENANQKLSILEEKYRLSFENVTDVICTVGADLVITDMSPSIERFTGIKPHYFIGRPVTSLEKFFKAESFEQLMANIHQVLQKGKTIPSATYEFIAQDESTLYIEISGAPLIRNEEIVGLISVSRDVTERTIAEERIRHHERLLEAINRVLSEALTSTTPESVAEMCLNVGQELTGSTFGFIGRITPDERFTTLALNDPGSKEYRTAEGHALSQIMDMVIHDMWGEIKRNEHSLIINDPEFFPEHFGVPEGHLPITAFLGVPLKEKDTVIGMIAMANNETGYTMEHAEDVQSLATFFVEAIRRKEVEALLKDNERKYRSIFEESNDAILLTAPDGSILDANPAACDMFGRSVEDIRKVGRNGLVDDSDPRLKTALEQRARTGKAVNAELTMLRSNGERFPVEGTSAIFTDAQGRQKTCMIIRDITERKQAEAALLERDERFRKLSSQVPGMIYQFKRKPDGTYCAPFTTEAIRDLFGCSPEDVLEDFSPIRKVVVPEDLEKLITSIESSAEQMNTWKCEYRVQIPGQPVKWLLGRSTPEKLSDGSIIWHGFNTDITDRKNIEFQREAAMRELRHEKEFNEALINNSPAFFVAISKDGKTIMMNEALLQTLGYTEDEVEGTDYLTTFVPEPERKSVSKVFEQLTTTIYPSYTNNTVLTKNGKRILVEWHGRSVFKEAGVFDYFFGVGIDITERTKMEEDLKQSFQQIRKGLHATVQAMAETVETRDPFTAGHQRRVSDLAGSIATEMNLPKDEIEGLLTAATIHDLGKISIPAEILSKPARLTNIEFALIKDHPQAGFNILKNIDFPWPVARIVLEHHERVDGTGYPNGLKGDEILLESRILAVADVVEAMCSHRPYRPSLGMDAALEEIARNRGTLYDTEVVDACLRLFHEKKFKLE
ncbi:MAG: PAS domain S-box protein [Deltaproteobacteria bacterium]|nr:PAS domain S-box protein [Deltaproteobacteria bacterium]